MLSSEIEQRLPQDQYLDLISLYVQETVIGMGGLPPKSKTKNMVTLTQRCKDILSRSFRVMQAMSLQ
jgi:hypothetical protein